MTHMVKEWARWPDATMYCGLEVVSLRIAWQGNGDEGDLFGTGEVCKKCFEGRVESVRQEFKSTYRRSGSLK